MVTIHGIDWQREKWKSGFGSKFIRQGEKNAVKYADEIIVLSKGVQDYFKDTYGRETHFIPNGVNRPETREAGLITEKFGLTKDSYILFLGRLVPEKGIRYLVKAFKNVKTDKKLVIAGGSSDTDSFMMELKELAKVNGSNISYDANGNPLSYRDGMSFEWENGRILKNITTSDKSVQMSYDSNGKRMQKSVDGVKTNYYYDSNKNLIALVKGNDTLLF